MRGYDAAVDALMAHAALPESAERVDAALRQLARSGNSQLADRFFAELEVRENAHGDAAAAAAAARHGVALTVLPMALRLRINPTGAAALAPTFGSEIRASAQALLAYRRARDRQPGNAWHWLVPFWLGAAPTEADVLRAVDAANQGRDVRAQIAASQQAAQWYEQQGRGQDAVMAMTLATLLAKASMADPASGIGERDYTLVLDAVAALHARLGRPDKAREFLATSVAIREQRAAAEPNDVQAQLDLIAACFQLANVPGRPPAVVQKGMDAYFALMQRHRFEPQLDASSLPGLIAMALAMGGLLTLVLGALLLGLYRFRVGRWMKRSSNAGPIGVPAAPRATLAGPTPVFESLRAGVPATGSAAMRSARRAIWGAVAVQIAAGMAFALLAAALYLWYGLLEFKPMRFAVIAWVQLWPLVFVLGLLWVGERRRLAWVLGTYFAVLLGFGVQQWLLAHAAPAAPASGGWLQHPLIQPLKLWLLTNDTSAFLLLFLNRRIRSIGPALLSMVLAADVGGVLVHIGASSWAGGRLVVGLTSLVHYLPPFWLMSALLFLAGMLLFAPLAWLMIRAVRGAYLAKWLNDQTLVFDALWLFQSVVLSSSLIEDAGLEGWVGLAAFAAYKLVAVLGSMPLVASARARPPARLLLLRVFGFRRRSERFFDVLGARWRYAGPIQLIAAPDLAASTLDPDEFMDFIGRRLRRQFLIEPGDLQRRLSQLDLRCDADGRYRVNEIFCGNDAWQPAVQALMRASELVVMDLRGFSPQNKGCLFEIESLLDSVAAQRIVLLVDATTDAALVRETIVQHSRRLDATSPNLANPGAITLLDVGADAGAAVDLLLRKADDLRDSATSATPPFSRSRSGSPAPA